MQLFPFVSFEEFQRIIFLFIYLHFLNSTNIRKSIDFKLQKLVYKNTEQKLYTFTQMYQYFCEFVTDYERKKKTSPLL